MKGRPLAETVGGLIPPADDPHMWELLRYVLCQVESDSQQPGVTRETLRAQWRRFVRDGGVPWLRAHFPDFEATIAPTGFIPAEGPRPQYKPERNQQ